MAELRLKQRSDTPAAVASNVVLFTDTDGNLNLRKPDGNILELAAAGNFTFTIPASGTPAMRNTVNTFTEAQTFNAAITSPGTKPASDSTTAIRLFRADGTTPVLTVDTTNSRVTAAGDLYARADTYGLFDRFVNTGVTPTDHFTAFSGWTWAGAPFATPSSISTATVASCLSLTHSSTTDNCFAYQSGVSAIARVFVGLDSYVGVRVDDGTTDNSLEVRAQASNTGTVSIVVISTTAGTPTTSTPYSDLMPEWFTLRANRISTLALPYVGTNGSFLSITAGSMGGLSWTATRAGIVFGQRGIVSNNDRRADIDWARIS